MAGKRKWNSEHYPKVIYARVTDQEHQEIIRRAELARMSASRYLVWSGTRQKLPRLRESLPPSPEQQEKLRGLLYELRRVGTNLNQLAYGFNLARMTGLVPPAERDILEAGAAVEALTKEIRGRL